MSEDTAISEESIMPEKLPAGLYVTGTPIGHLKDITLRALETLRMADVILAEDTRISIRLLSRYVIRKPLLSHHKFNEAQRTEEVLRRIEGGEAVALITDSGMPGVSDPGSRLVRACRARGLPVTAVPGPSALTTAIALCGLDAEGYVFGGFLPHKAGARRRMLERLLLPALPVVLYESPYRLVRLLEEVRDLPGTYHVFVGRELTKKFEECRSGSPDEVLGAYSGRTVKGELVVVVKPDADRSLPAHS